MIEEYIGGEFEMKYSVTITNYYCV